MFTFDLRHAWRGLRARPLFTGAAALTLALGIGATTAIFSVVEAVLLRQPPYPEAQRLVWITNTIPRFGAEIVAAADYLDWRDHSRTLAAIAAYDDARSMAVRPRGTAHAPEHLGVARISSSLLPLLGVRPARGRNLQAADQRVGAEDCAMISQRLWSRWFGPASTWREARIDIDGRSHRITGLLPREFRFPLNAEVEILVPLVLDEPLERGRTTMSILKVLGRLAAGASIEQARAELEDIQRRALRAPAPGGSAAEHAGAAGPAEPTERRGGPRMEIRGGGPGAGPPFRLESRVKLVRLRDHIGGRVRRALLLLATAVGFVLSIACANLANLMLARATARERELAVRAALGAGRWGLARLLLAESLLLALIGGSAGVALAYPGIRGLAGAIPAELAGGLFRQVEIAVDCWVLLYSAAATLLSGLAFGLVPALLATRVAPAEPLKQAGHGIGRRGRMVRDTLAGVQVAIVLVLLVGAGLLIRSLLKLQQVDPGFTSERVLSFAVDLEGASGEAGWLDFYQQLADRLRALPGVEAVGYTDSVPLTEFTMIVVGLHAPGREPPPLDQAPEIAISLVSPDYFRALGYRLLRGRDFSHADRAGAEPVAIVNQRLACLLFGAEDPVGRPLTIGPRSPSLRIVGLVADVRHQGLELDPRPELYLPFLSQPRSFAFVAVRTRGNPDDWIAGVRRQVGALDDDVPVYDISTMEQRLATALAPRRFQATALGVFAALALMLAAVGLYGVMAYGVAERRRELAIRIALGAGAAAVRWLILRRGLLLAAAGVAAGLPAALGAGRLLGRALYGIPSVDGVTYGIAVPLLLLVALLAALLPARRAVTVDPMTTLRDE